MQSKSWIGDSFCRLWESRHGLGDGSQLAANASEHVTPPGAGKRKEATRDSAVRELAGTLGVWHGYSEVIKQPGVNALFTGAAHACCFELLLTDLHSSCSKGQHSIMLCVSCRVLFGALSHGP